MTDDNGHRSSDAYDEETLREALREIAGYDDVIPAYRDWGGDTEDAETWGLATGRIEAANIARRALGMHELVAPETPDEEKPLRACAACPHGIFDGSDDQWRRPGNPASQKCRYETCQYDAEEV